MDTLVSAFGPSFAAALALQQLIELVKPALAGLKDKKAIVIKIVSLIIGIALACLAGLRTLAHLGYTGPAVWDCIITGLIISGGTEGFNSILKFMGYSKDKAKKAA